MAHLLTLDKATVLGTNLFVVFASMARIEPWNERRVPKWANRPVPELLIGLDRWGRRLAGLYRAIPRGPVRREASHVPGPGTAGDDDVVPGLRRVDPPAGHPPLARLGGRGGRPGSSRRSGSTPSQGFESGPDEPADARISVSAPAFVMAAAGRGSFDALLADGRVSVEGNEAVGREFLRAVRIL